MVTFPPLPTANSLWLGLRRGPHKRNDDKSFIQYLMHINHEEYYRDRLTERDLCFDFPGDAILIDGLHAMQSHFGSNNVPVDIPVVRVMNTAHFLAAYMFATTCSGDQMEYDVLAYGSIGHDKKLVMVTMLVLAAMLERTEGVRAHNCRNLIISGRGEDFEEGMTLYERFLRSAEKRFAEEDFLIDTHAQIQKLIAENEQLTEEINKQTEIIQNLKYSMDMMENQKPHTVVYNYGIINDIHDNPNATIYAVDTEHSKQSSPSGAEDVTPVEEEKGTNIDSIIFTKKAQQEAKQGHIIDALQKSVQGRKDKTRAFVSELQEWQKEGYVDAHYNARVMYDELDKIMPLTFGYNAFRKHYNNLQ